MSLGSCLMVDLMAGLQRFRTVRELSPLLMVAIDHLFYLNRSSTDEKNPKLAIDSIIWRMCNQYLDVRAEPIA